MTAGSSYCYLHHHTKSSERGADLGTDNVEIKKNSIIGLGPTRKSKNYFRWITAQVGQVPSVVDIGCGDGIVETLLNSGQSYLGFDIGADIYPRHVRRNIKYIEDIDCLYREIKLLQDLELVLMMDVLEHTESFVKMFDLVLMQGPKLVFVSLPNETNLTRRIQFLRGHMIPAHGVGMVDTKKGHRHSWLIDYRDAVQLLTKRGANIGYKVLASVDYFDLEVGGFRPKVSIRSLIARILPSYLSAQGFGVLLERM